MLADISETEYRIAITLDLPPDEEYPEAEAPVIILTVRYPEDYPDTPPELVLAAPPNAPSHPYFSVADDQEQLRQSLSLAIEENIGMAMVFSLVSTLKESAEQLVADRRAVVAKVKEDAMLAVEREENKKFHGTLVTRETFLRWRESFLNDMEEERVREEDERLAELKKARVKEPVKLTGKQLWEGGMVGKTEEEDEDELVEDAEKLKVTE
jgi:hypothetical protein